MRARATIFDVAERAGVSVVSVSRALRGAAGVRPELRERIKRVADELGYVPSGPAASLASRRLGAVGLVFPDLDDPSIDPSTDGGRATLLYEGRDLGGVVRWAALDHLHARQGLGGDCLDEAEDLAGEKAACFFLTRDAQGL